MRLVFVLVSVALASACAAEHASPCPQLDEVLAFEERLHRADCALFARCYNDGDDTFGFGWLLDRCDASSETDPTDVERLCADLASGATVFHPDRVAGCSAELDRRATRDCITAPSYDTEPVRLWSVPSSCTEVVEVTITDVATNDGDCLAHRCEADYVCVASSSGCGGECVRRPGVGDPCGLGCAEGTHCDFATRRCASGCQAAYDCHDGRRCVDGACVDAVLPDVGAPCLSSPSEHDTRCAGLHTYCNQRTQICAEQAQPGEACDLEGGARACVAGRCDPASGACVPDAWCFPPDPPLFTCLPDAPYCSLDHSCTSDPVTARCDALGPDDGVEQCPPGYGCDLRGWRDDLSVLSFPCRLRAELGATCDATVVCVNGSTCFEGRCTPIAGVDEACGFPSARVRRGASVAERPVPSRAPKRSGSRATRSASAARVRVERGSARGWRRVKSASRIVNVRWKAARAGGAEPTRRSVRVSTATDGRPSAKRASSVSLPPAVTVPSGSVLVPARHLNQRS